MGKLIIFDCDGVLVDSEELSIDVLTLSLKERNIRVLKSDITRIFKGAKFDSILLGIEKKYSVKLPTDFQNEFREREKHFFENNLKAVEGVESVLKNINESVCVASSAPIDKIKNSLQKTGLLKYFAENIFSSYQISSWKPDPGIFLHAANEMGFEPTDCIVIEDSLVGVQAAVKAKMDVFGFECHGTHELEVYGAKSFSKMEYLPNLIDSLTNFS